MNNVIELTEVIAACTATAMFTTDAPYMRVRDVPVEDGKLILHYSGSANISDFIKKIYLNKFSETIDEMEEPYNDELTS